MTFFFVASGNGVPKQYVWLSLKERTIERSGAATIETKTDGKEMVEKRKQVASLGLGKHEISCEGTGWQRKDEEVIAFI